LNNGLPAPSTKIVCFHWPVLTELFNRPEAWMASLHHSFATFPPSQWLPVVNPAEYEASTGFDEPAAS
jgi:hypothetical protein